MMVCSYCGKQCMGYCVYENMPEPNSKELLYNSNKIEQARLKKRLEELEELEARLMAHEFKLKSWPQFFIKTIEVKK